MNIQEFANQLNELIEDNKKLSERLDLYKRQLLVILINNEGKIKNLDYPDLTNIDLDKITIGIGMDSCSLYTKKEGVLLKSWKQLSKIQRNP